jgi:hypothetical protein
MIKLFLISTSIDLSNWGHDLERYQKETSVMTDIFFLGGHDAEMLEIRNMLDQKNIAYFDHQLKWGAKLSAYQDELNSLDKDKTPVFVELKLDCPYPENAVIIDHHDSRAGKDQLTAIEQTAQRLDVQMNRHQQLVSINDKAHIRGMKAFGATDAEIDNIRTLDRKAQGATEKDEQNAQKTIAENIRIFCTGVAVIQSLCERTSCVVDRIHDQYSHIIVFSPDGNMHYFGPGENVFHFRDVLIGVQEKNPTIEFWYGGDLPEFGFLGSTFQFTDKFIAEYFCPAS